MHFPRRPDCTSYSTFRGQRAVLSQPSLLNITHQDHLLLFTYETLFPARRIHKDTACISNNKLNSRWMQIEPRRFDHQKSPGFHRHGSRTEKIRSQQFNFFKHFAVEWKKMPSVPTPSILDHSTTQYSRFPHPSHQPLPLTHPTNSSPAAAQQTQQAT